MNITRKTTPTTFSIDTSFELLPSMLLHVHSRYVRQRAMEYFGGQRRLPDIRRFVLGCSGLFFFFVVVVVFFFFMYVWV